MTVTVLVVKRELSPDAPPARGFRYEPQPDWLGYADAGRRIGPIDAPVLFVEFADFQCPACRVLAQRFDSLLAKYPGDVAVLYRHFPIPSHKHAFDAAIASECAGRQGRFAEMHHALFSDQRQIGTRPWVAFAQESGIADVSEFGRCMSDSSVRAVVDRDKNAALKIGATGTPTVLVNGIRFSGTAPETVLDSLVTDGVRRARNR